MIVCVVDVDSFLMECSMMCRPFWHWLDGSTNPSDGFSNWDMIQPSSARDTCAHLDVLTDEWQGIGCPTVAKFCYICKKSKIYESSTPVLARVFSFSLGNLSKFVLHDRLH